MLRLSWTFINVQNTAETISCSTENLSTIWKSINRLGHFSSKNAEHVLVPVSSMSIFCFVYHCTLNILGFWNVGRTKGATFLHFIDRTINCLMEKTAGRLVNEMKIICSCSPNPKPAFVVCKACFTHKTTLQDLPNNSC